jgi:hypothetical protein
MPYAANGKVSTNPFEGAVEITQEQYKAAISGMTKGQMIKVDGGFAAIDPPEPEPKPEPEPPTIEDRRAGMSLTFAQLLIGLVAEGWITEAEGDAWLEGRIPSAARNLIGTLPQAQRFAARARAARPSTVLRNDPLVIALASAQGKADDLDRFFTTYAVA